MSMDIKVYKCSAERCRIDKSGYLTYLGLISGSFNTDFTLSSLVITYNSKSDGKDYVPDFNYIYIEALHRYYYVTEVRNISTYMWEISLEIDVLYTYKDAIKSLTAFVDRNENNYNSYIIDNRVVYIQGATVEDVTISNELFDGPVSYTLNGFALDVG